MRVHYSTYSQCRLHYCYTYGKINAGAAQGELPVCVAVRYLTLRIGCERYGRKNPLPYSFSKRSHIGNLRQIRKQGKGRSSKRKGNVGVPSFLPRRGRGNLPRSAERNDPAESQRKTCRPDRVNRLRGSSAPVNRCREKTDV